MRVLILIVSIFCAVYSGAFAIGDDSHLYLLSNPQKAQIKLFSPALQYIGLALSTPVKIALAAKVVGLYPAAAYYGTDPFFWPLMAPANSLAELKFRAWRERMKLLQDLKNIPDLKRVRILSLADTTFKRFLAQNQEQTEVITINTGKPLPTDPEELKKTGWKSEWGKPIAIPNPREANLEISLTSAAGKSPTEWRPSLQDFFDRTPPPESVLESWRKDLKAWDKEYVKLQATVAIKGETSEPLGSIAEGRMVHKRLKPRFFGASAHSLPLVDVAVVDKAEANCATIFKSYLGMALIR